MSAGATMIFEIKLVALNNKFIHEIEAEALEQEKAEADRLDLLLAQRIGHADSPYCDACNTCVIISLNTFYQHLVQSLVDQSLKA